MNLLIIEDEQPAAEKLRRGVQEYDPDIFMHETQSTVRDSVRWLQAHAMPDLVLMDIQLADGISLDIFHQVEIRCPVIFITAYDAYLQQAFDHNAIDYLLKPVRREKLHQALEKYQKLKTYFTAQQQRLISEIRDGAVRSRERILLKKGGSFVSLPVSEMAYAFTEHKITFVVATSGERYMADLSLQELEEQLASASFFRVNRKYLASPAAVRRFSLLGKGRLKVELTPAVEEEVVVSQETAAAFKAWMDGRS